MSEPFQSLTGAPARFRARPEHGVLRVSGGDRVRFLNGMLTQDVEDLAQGRAVYAAQLDRKGHVLADLWLLALGPELWLDVAAARAAAVAELLEKHLIADDVEIAAAGDALGRIDFEGPGAVRAAGAPALERDQVLRDPEQRVWIGGGALGDEGVRVLAAPDALQALIASSGLEPLAAEHAEVLRIERFQPAFGVDIDERTFPAEARLEHAISFKKGCYIGHEIVARVESRGAVKRLLVKLRADGPLASGAEITSDGRSVGRVTSAVVSPREGPLALGYVKRAHAKPGTELRVDGVRASVVFPPLDTPA